MNAEGMARFLSPEWLRALATVIPVLLALWWVLKGQGALWRRSVWSAVGTDAHALCEEHQGRLRVRWTGYELRAEGVRVRWYGGLSGRRTFIRDARGRRRLSGWLDANAVRQQLSAR